MLDRNHLQIDGTTETVMNSAPLEEKLKAFNFNVITIDGHDFDQIEAAMQAFHAETAKPTCIVLDTHKGHRRFLYGECRSLARQGPQ